MRNGQTLILATVSQQLMLDYGKVFRNPVTTRMANQNNCFQI